MPLPMEAIGAGVIPTRITSVSPNPVKRRRLEVEAGKTRVVRITDHSDLPKPMMNNSRQARPTAYVPLMAHECELSPMEPAMYRDPVESLPSSFVQGSKLMPPLSPN